MSSGGVTGSQCSRMYGYWCDHRDGMRAEFCHDARCTATQRGDCLRRQDAVEIDSGSVCGAAHGAMRISQAVEAVEASASASTMTPATLSGTSLGRKKTSPGIVMTRTCGHSSSTVRSCGVSAP